MDSLSEQPHFEDFDSYASKDDIPTTIGLNELPERVSNLKILDRKLHPCHTNVKRMAQNAEYVDDSLTST